MPGLPVGEAARQSGWSARMLRYLELAGLVIPGRSPTGYRLYGLRELDQLRSLSALRATFAVELTELAFAARLRHEPALRVAVDAWLAGAESAPSAAERRAWVEWEQRKHERLLAA